MSELVEQITLAYERDQENAPIAELSSQLPESYESITTRWLTNVLCWGVIGAEVVDLKLDSPDNGTSNRRRMEVTYNAIGQQASLPTKLFCKASHGLNNRLVLAITDCVRSEVIFYKAIRPLVDFETPQCYFAAYDTYSYNSMVILGDFSDRIESLCDHRTPINRTRAESQVRLLATLHAQFYQSPLLESTLGSLPTWTGFFTRAMESTMEGANNGFLAAEEVIPDRLYQQFDKIWPATVAAVEQHHNLPHTVAHNDVHPKNWYVLPNDEMGLSDWQCCTRGHWSRDLAYAISTALTVEDRRSWERELIQLYLDEMARQGVDDTSFEQAWDLYRQELLSALPWWTATLSPPEGYPEMQPQETSLEFIRRITTAIDDLDALTLFA